MGAKRRIAVIAVICVASVLLVLGLASALAAQSPVPRPLQLDFARASAAPSELVGQSVYVVGRVSTEILTGGTRLALVATKGDYTMLVDVTLTRPLTEDVRGLDTMLVTGTVARESTSKRLVLSSGACEKVCRLRGRLGDGDLSYEKAVLFALPYGSAERAVAKGKEGLIDLVTSGKIVGVSSAAGEYDIVVPTGKSDVMAIYKDPKGKTRSMLWIISLDFGADSLRFDLGPKSAILL